MSFLCPSDGATTGNSIYDEELAVCHSDESDGVGMATVVNLDALITREDFEVVADARQSWRKTDTLQIHELEAKRFTYGALRKPDFQRETASWGPEKVHDLVKTFLDGDLIPAIILWESAGNIFVIDGSHRLSALIAWVQNDYGDGAKSCDFFQNRIPDEQSRSAERTRELINRSIGTYQAHLIAVEHPEQASPEMLSRARRLASLALQLQWVPAGDAKQAEASFFKINQEATRIDPTELRILKSRRSANAVAARVIVRSATGHRYWQPFAQDRQSEIERIGREVYPLLFEPPLENPIKTLVLPIAGKSGQALPLVFDFINVANDVPVVDETKGKGKRVAEGRVPDEDGATTLQYLKRARDLTERMIGTKPASLGLDPVVYFYSLSGRHQPTAFLAAASFVKLLIARQMLDKFTKFRAKFEDFLIGHKGFVQQIVVKRGSGAKGFDWVRDYYIEILEMTASGLSEDEIVTGLKSGKFAFLSTQEVQEDEISGKRFSRSTKSNAYIRPALENALRCSICGARLISRSIHIDHDERREDGGSNRVENAKLTHPYCNTGYKA